MINEGAQAPPFELPAVIEGRPGWVSFEEFLGESVVVLAFYPADFNPSCTDESTDLSEFDVFRMQSDATVLAISGDSLYSHRAFARHYDLRLPLLADIRNEVADAYGVSTDDSRYPNQRAVVVIDHDGQVTYTWAADNVEERPDIEAVQAAFRAVGDADLAETQYRHGCERYNEGRDTFVDGMSAYKRREWVLARGKFETALAKLDSAGDAFQRAVRFSETEAMIPTFERGVRVVEELDRAVTLLSDAASAHANRNGQQASRMREEAETALSTVRDLGGPPDPEDIPADLDDSAGDGLSGIDTTLDISEPETSVATAGTAGSTSSADTPESDGAIDEAALEALTAEIETQELSDDKSSNDG